MDDYFEVNLSPSSINTYRQCELQFYYEKIAKAEPDTEVPTIYGDAGTIVHHVIENGFDKKLFNKLWKEAGIAKKTGFYGHKIKRADYWEMVERAKEFCQVIDVALHEETITIPLITSYNTNICVKGIIDMICMDGNRLTLLDWKTGKVQQGKEYLQAKHYSYLWWRLYGESPKFLMYYLRFDKFVTYEFTEEDFKEYEEYLLLVAVELMAKRNSPERYNHEGYDTGFNSHKAKCYSESLKREVTHIAGLSPDPEEYELP